MEIRYKKNGSTIYFSGSDGIDDTKGIIDEDKPIKLVVIDEVSEFFEDGEGEDELQNIEATFIRGNSSGFQMIYLYNPPKNPNAPIVKWCKKMEQRPDCIHIHTDYRDVPVEWLGQDLVDSAEQMKELDEKQYNWVWLGLSIGVDELIYYMFSDKHKAMPTQKKYKMIGIGCDYGQQNATTFQAFGLDIYNKKLEGLDEYYHSGRETGKQKSPSEYADALIEFASNLSKEYLCNIVYVFIDPSAAGFIEEVKRRRNSLNFQLLINKAENDVALGISRVQKLLIYEIMSVSPKQKHLIEEFGVYEYDKKALDRGVEIPIKESDHCCDATRYDVMGLWTKLKYFLPVAEREDEKE